MRSVAGPEAVLGQAREVIPREGGAVRMSPREIFLKPKRPYRVLTRTK